MQTLKEQFYILFEKEVFKNLKSDIKYYEKDSGKYVISDGFKIKVSRQEETFNKILKKIYIPYVRESVKGKKKDYLASLTKNRREFIHDEIDPPLVETRDELIELYASELFGKDFGGYGQLFTVVIEKYNNMDNPILSLDDFNKAYEVTTFWRNSYSEQNIVTKKGNKPKWQSVASNDKGSYVYRIQLERRSDGKLLTVEDSMENLHNYMRNVLKVAF